MTGQLLLAAMLLVLAAMLGRHAQVAAAPTGEELDDLGDDGVESPQLAGFSGAGRRAAHQAGQLEGDDLGQAAATAGSGGNFNNDMGQQQYQNFRPQQRQMQPASNYNNALQQQASENSENSADDNETDADDDSDFGPMGLTSANAGAASAHNGAAYPRAPSSWGAEESAQAMPLQGGAGIGAQYEGEIESALDGAGEPDGLDSNIANAKIEMSPQDMATAAGHHHHHGHYPHGWLKMGAETGKKGAFKWHDKHPVGGKGRR